MKGVGDLGLFVWLKSVSLLVLIGASAFPLFAQRVPAGLYAKVNVEDAKNNVCQSETDVHTCVQDLYQHLLQNPAISGLTVGVHWDKISKLTGYDWSDIDDIFTAVESVHRPRTVQLIVTPGFDTPDWVLSKLESCDPLFKSGRFQPDKASATCGKITFTGFPQQQHSDHHVLPLPWNSVYQNDWQNFLRDLYDKYFDHHEEWVAIVMGGPTAGSNEIILPDTQNSHNKLQFGNFSVDEIWSDLLLHAFSGEYNNSYIDLNEAVVKPWNAVIENYQTIFHGMTLILGPDSGNDLPSFSNGGVPINPPPNVKDLYDEDCKLDKHKSIQMSCEAKTEVIEYFIESTGLPGAAINAKATQVGGMRAASDVDDGNIGISGVKLLSIKKFANPPLLAGAEFDHPVTTTKRQRETVGCPTSMCMLTPVTAAYNVLAVFFAGTQGFSYFDMILSEAPRSKDQGFSAGLRIVDYLDLPYQDVKYAMNPAHACPPADEQNTELGKMSLQDLYERAVNALYVLHHPGGVLPVLPKPTCRQ